MLDIRAEWLKGAMAATRDPKGKLWSQASLARVARISRETIWKILQRKTDAEDATITALAKALGLAPPRIGVARDTTMPSIAPQHPVAARSAVEASDGGLNLALGKGTAGGGDSDLDVLARRLLAMIQGVVARAVYKVLAADNNEATRTHEGRRALARELRKFALGLQENVIAEATAIFAAADALEEGRLT